jgi:hypothetical protein
MCGTYIEPLANGCARTEHKKLKPDQNLGYMGRVHDNNYTPHIAGQYHEPQRNEYRHGESYHMHCIGIVLQDHGNGGTGHIAPKWREELRQQHRWGERLQRRTGCPAT